jgi:uncharacterized protein (UPF0303 family)
MTDGAQPDLISELERQEEHLRFTGFDNDDAWMVGSLLA